MSSTETLSEISDLLLSGESALSVGDYKAALGSFLEAFALNPGNREVQTQLFAVLSCTDGYHLPPAFTEAIAKVAEHNEHDIQMLASVVRNQYDCDEPIEQLTDALENLDSNGQLSNEDHETLSSIFEDRLVRLVLTKAIAISPELENLVATLRHFHLNGWHSGLLNSNFSEVNTDILSLIACQAFNTQYVYSVSKHEQELVDALTTDILRKMPTASPQTLALAACYVPLNILLSSIEPAHIDDLTEMAENWPHAMRQVWKQQVLEPLYELQIRETLPALTPMPEASSGTIREQYETFPYPRWQTINLPQPTTLSEFATANLETRQLPELPKGPIDVLIAGCGTGRQVVDIAKSFETKNILAVDISKSSSAYAYRKAQEYSLENTHFALADVTQIADWDATFDLIVCTGVLHHLKNPSEGLKGLLGVSKPNSIFMLALYSARARKAATAAREFIIQNNIPSELPAIREMRDAVRDLPYDHALAPIQESQEFYSASGLVDYIFNKQETCYSPLELKNFLNSHNLEFLGFHKISNVHRQQYAEMFPDDTSRVNLDHWETYEIEYPSVFTGMMQFWCCKKASSFEQAGNRQDSFAPILS